MNLEDAKSKDEVAQAIAAGDQDMIDSVDAFLEAARDSFMESTDHYGEERDPFGYSYGERDAGILNIVDGNDEFLNKVIAESASTGFDLSKVPRELVASNIQYTSKGKPQGSRFAHWGPFAIWYEDDRDSPSLDWRYKIKGDREIIFREEHFPDTDLAELIPEAQVKAFWKDLALELSSWDAKRAKVPDFEWHDDTSVLHENYGFGEGNDYAIGSFDEEKFTEWCRDIVSEHANNLVNSDPKAAYDLFLQSAKLNDGAKALLQKGQETEGDNWPTEDVMDFVVKFFEEGDESAREEVVTELDNYLLKTYDPESLMPEFLTAVENFILSKYGSSVRDEVLKDWNDARADGFFTEEDLETFAGEWLDDGRNLDYRYGLVRRRIENELKRYRFEKNPEPAVENFINEVIEALKKTSVGEAGAAVVRKAIEEKHFSKKNVLEMAFDWSKGDKRRLVTELEDYADALIKGKDLPEASVVANISKADIAKLGITTGYLAEEGPFKLIKLRPQDLAAEGRRMRHCVGDSPSYAREVAAGNTEIWSLRDRNNKPHFTLEINTGIHRYKPDASEIEDETSDSNKWYKQRAQFVKQLKGKANRTPGFDERSSSGVTKPDEVTLWRWLLKKLHIHPEQVQDFSGARIPVSEQRAQQLQASVYRPSTQRLSARLDAIADRLRGRAPRALVAAVDDAAFALAE